MDTQPLQSLLTTSERAHTAGFIFDRRAVERSAVTLFERGPLSPQQETTLASFLDFVVGEDLFDPKQKEHAAWFLRRLREGKYRSPIPSWSVVTRAPPPPVPASAVALAIPAGTQPAIDLLIRTPHESLLRLYNQAIAQNIGTHRELEAIRRVLWLRPLVPEDYRSAVGFLEKIDKSSIVFKPTQREHAWFLIELLAPGSDPHRIVARLKSSGLAQGIHAQSREMPVVVEVLRKGRLAESLDGLLLRLSTLMQQAAEDGDTHKLEKLALAARRVADAIGVAQFDKVGLKKPKVPFLNSLFQPMRPFQKGQYSWQAFDQVATSPYVNAALMPLSVVEHVLASAVIGEISWRESWDEAVDVLEGSALVGGTLLGTLMGWQGLVGFFGDKKVGQLLKRVNTSVSPRVRAYLVPVLFLSIFAFMAMRETQELPLDEAWDYRRQMMQELLEGLGVNFVATGGTFFAINHLLMRLRRVPAGKAGATGVLALAAGAGMLFQEFYIGWRRKQMRHDLKEKTYTDLVNLMEMIPKAEEYMRPRLLENADRKLSVLIALNVLESPSVQQAIKQAMDREQMIGYYSDMGLSKEMADKLSGWTEKEEPLTPSQKEIANAWIGKMSGKEGRAMLPVSVLPAQKRRILALWESDLADIHRFLARPIPLTIGRNADGTVQSEQFSHWNIAHTMALLRRYVTLRENLGISGSGNVSVDTEKEGVPVRFH